MQSYGVPGSSHPRGSTVGEGFVFGCGFLLASFLAVVGMAIGVVLLNLLLAALGAALFAM